MEITSTPEEDVLVLGLSGDFDTTETETYSAEISGAIEAGMVRILLVLDDLAFINSTALGTLLLSQKRLAQYGGGIAASGANSQVDKTFRLLELNKKIPLFEERAQALLHLRELNPETVSASGEEVEFLRQDAEETFGTRPRRGRLIEMHENGVTFSFDNLDRLDPDVNFPAGAPVFLRFLLPLYHPSHVFKVESEVRTFETVGRETLQIRVLFTAISEAEKEAVKQYVKDLRLLKGEM